MPIYDFECPACKHQFSLAMSVSELEKGKVVCPACKKEGAKQILSIFTAKTSRKS